jgi:hypothetical protein
MRSGWRLKGSAALELAAIVERSEPEAAAFVRDVLDELPVD